MYNATMTETAKMVMDIPKAFWRYYDLYRREEISLEEYSVKSDLPEDEIIHYLSVV